MKKEIEPYGFGRKVFLFRDFREDDMSTTILGLQPRDRAAMLGVNAMECFLEELK